MSATVPVTLKLSSQGAEALSGDLKKVAGTLDSMRKGQEQFNKMGAAMASFAGNLAAMAVQGAKQFVVETYREIAGINDLAAAFGLGTDAYQKLDYAAKLGGTSIEAITVGMKTLAKQVEAGNPALSELGLSLEKLRSMAPEQAFQLVGEAIYKIEDPLKRLSLSQEMFGRGGPAVAKVASEYERIAASFERLGLGIPKETLDAAEKFDDLMVGYGTVWKSRLSKLFAFLGGGSAENDPDRALMNALVPGSLEAESPFNYIALDDLLNRKLGKKGQAFVPSFEKMLSGWTPWNFNFPQSTAASRLAPAWDPRTVEGRSAINRAAEQKAIDIENQQLKVLEEISKNTLSSVKIELYPMEIR